MLWIGCPNELTRYERLREYKIFIYESFQGMLFKNHQNS